jgi:hypothetical protein
MFQPLAAMSDWVIVLLSSEVPEELMNCPVYLVSIIYALQILRGLRVALLDIKPRFGLLCSKVQAYPTN